MSLTELVILIYVFCFAYELRKIRRELEELNRHLTSMELNFILKSVRKK